MKSLHLLCLSFVLVCSINATAQDIAKPEFKSAEMKRTIESFGNAIETSKNRFADAVSAATEKYNLEVESLRNKQIELLESFQKTATQSNDLDEAIKIRDFAKSVREDKIELPDFPKLLEQAYEKNRILQGQVAELTTKKSKSQMPSLIGTWRWCDGRDAVFDKSGQANHAQRLRGNWRVSDGIKDSFSVTWQNGSTDTLKISEDGKLLYGTSSDQNRVWAVRLK